MRNYKKNNISENYICKKTKRTCNKDIKRNNAITLISLIITIVVLLIIAAASFGVGSYTMSAYTDSILESEAKELQSAIISQYQKYLTVEDKSLLIGNACDEYGNLNSNGEYYLLNTEDLIKLGMENPKDTYIVKYSTGEVINKTTPENSKGEKIHLKGN